MDVPTGPEDGRTRPPRRGRPRVGRDNASMGRIVELYFRERLSMREVASVVGLSHMTVYRMLNEVDLSKVVM